MRLWNKSLISALPRQQLVAQWRELASIATSLSTKGTPNHVLVNKVLDYSFDHFITYAKLVRSEMTRRGYRTMNSVWEKIENLKPDWKEVDFQELYKDWHNKRYLLQCYYNLEEKYDCGGISKEEFEKIIEIVSNKKFEEAVK